ncbi:MULTISPECIES: hypothetical protein [Paenibacillus]|uniref:hypothetical protein n=1 Tax=Paenibacillus TaxID=44249 RepID=UPI00159620BA|nr:MULTISPECIES: hypothetical protein [Paenibacillus]
MEIRTNEYTIAALNEEDSTLKAIQDAEATIAQITGRDITLIAYEKKPIDAEE